MNLFNAENTRSIVIVALCLVVVAWGCGEEAIVLELEEVSADSEVSSEKSAIITPEFQLSGLEGVPFDLTIDELGLGISEIRLEPVNGDGGIAYSTSQPFHLHFDLAGGELAVQRGAVELPETGHFLISVRLEPLDEVDDGDYLGGSLGMAGRIRSDGAAFSDESANGEEASNGSGESESGGEEHDSDPIPLPFDLYHSLERGDWTPFKFTSDQVVFYTFSDVELVAGGQVLTFDFNLRDWATGAVAPLLDNVEKSLADPDLDQEIIDITQDFDSPDAMGPESLMNAGTVSAHTQR
jgi:hypothetical protein